VPSVLSAYLLGLAASLNHFHRPISDALDKSFPRSVTLATQNLTARNRVSAWLLGGLVFHIEHHLFATMPRRNYRIVTDEIRAYCRRNGLPYKMVTLRKAIASLWHKLNNPYEEVAPPRPSLPDVHSQR
jgi:fatty acid desaturase